MKRVLEETLGKLVVGYKIGVDNMRIARNWPTDVYADGKLLKEHCLEQTNVEEIAGSWGLVGAALAGFTQPKLGYHLVKNVYGGMRKRR